MIGENWQLVTDEPVEFEKLPVEVQDRKKITDHFRGIYKIYPNSIKENRRMSTCNLLDLQILGSNRICPKISPIIVLNYMRTPPTHYFLESSGRRRTGKLTLREVTAEVACPARLVCRSCHFELDRETEDDASRTTCQGADQSAANWRARGAQRQQAEGKLRKGQKVPRTEYNCKLKQLEDSSRTGLDWKERPRAGKA